MRATIALLVSLSLAAASPAAASHAPASSEICDARGAARTSAPIGRSPCPGVRPGALIQMLNKGCTMNFLFRGSDRHIYGGSAGHCFTDRPEMVAVHKVGEGPEVADADGTRIGEVAFFSNKEGVDFGLFRLDKGVEFDPQMCHWGGPTSIAQAVTDGDLLRQYGHGTPTGEASLGGSRVSTVPARSSIVHGSDGWFVYAYGVSAPQDSGSPVITADGRALGTLVSVGFRPFHGINRTVRLARSLGLARKHTGVRFRLLTAPVVD